MDLSLLYFWESLFFWGLREWWLLHITLHLNSRIACSLLVDYCGTVQALFSLVEYVIGSTSRLLNHLNVLFFRCILRGLPCHFEHLSLLQDLCKRRLRLCLGTISHPILHHLRIWVSLSGFDDSELGWYFCLVDEVRLDELWTLLAMDVYKARLLVAEVIDWPFAHLLTVIVLVMQMSQPLHLALWSVEESGKLWKSKC